MTKVINIILDDREHKQLSKLKMNLKLTWDQCLKNGIKALAELGKDEE